MSGLYPEDDPLVLRRNHDWGREQAEYYYNDLLELFCEECSRHLAERKAYYNIGLPKLQEAFVNGWMERWKEKKNEKSNPA